MEGKKDLPEWDKLNSLGKEYQSFVKQGYGTKVGEGVDNRHPMQVSVINQILEGTQRYIGKIATDLILGIGVKLPTPTGGIRLSLKNFEVSVDELVNEASLALIKSFKNYDSDKGTVANFISYNAASAMYRYAVSNSGPIRLPSNMNYKLNKAYVKNKPIEKTIEKTLDVIESLLKREAHGRTALANLIFNVYLGKYDEIDSISEQYESKDSNPEEIVSTLEMGKKLDDILGKLKPNQETVIRLRYGLGVRRGTKEYGVDQDCTLEQIGEWFGFSREWIRQLEKKAINNLRHPTKKRPLRGYLPLS